MVNFSSLFESEPSEPVEYRPLDLDDLEKVSPGVWSPVAGRRIIDSGAFLLEFREREVIKTRGFFDNDAAYGAFYENYLQHDHINHELAEFLSEASRTPEEIKQEIRSLNRFIEELSDNDPIDASTLISAQALKRRRYVSSPDDLSERARQYTDLIEASELELWMIARKNGSNKDAIAMQLKGAGVIDFGEGKALRPLFADKNGKIGTLPKKYCVDPLLHTPI
jgi:hypothetical protein